MLDHSLLILGAFRLDALVLGPGETSLEVLGPKAIAVVLLRGHVRCNGIDLVPWRSRTVSGTCCLQAQEPSLVARFSIDGPDALHLGGPS